MLFRRRTPEPLTDRVRVALWPRRSWSRSGRYYAARLQRMTGSPHAVALGLAIGVFCAFTPIYGVHLAVSAGLAWLFRASTPAAIAGAMLNNPATAAGLLGASFAVGKIMLPEDHPAHHLPPPGAGWWLRAFDRLEPVVLPTLIGGIPLGLGVGMIVYAAARAWLTARQEQKRQQLLDRTRP